MSNNYTEVLDHLISETMASFDEVKKLKEEGREKEINYDYELLRDRKAVIALKTIMSEVHYENMEHRRKKLNDKPKIKQLN